MTQPSNYAYLIEEIEAELQQESSLQVKDSLKSKIKKLEELKEQVKEIESEVKQLAKDGKITDLSSYIKVAEGLDVSKGALLMLKKDHKSKQQEINMSLTSTQ